MLCVQLVKLVAVHAQEELATLRSNGVAHVRHHHTYSMLGAWVVGNVDTSMKTKLSFHRGRVFPAYRISFITA